MKREKEIHASFAVTPQSAKVMATMCDLCLGNMEKALNLWMKTRENACPAYQLDFYLRYACVEKKNIIGFGPI